jgi:hypothetical protein
MFPLGPRVLLGDVDVDRLVSRRDSIVMHGLPAKQKQADAQLTLPR